jgi:hypothetical protein
MKRLLAVGLLAALSTMAANILVIKQTALPWIPVVPGFTGQTEIFVFPDNPATTRVMVTVHTPSGIQTVDAPVTFGFALAWFETTEVTSVSAVEVQ